MRCWEYMNHGPGGECRECIVYRLRASLCFRIASLARGTEHAKRFCTGLCQECPYYRRVHGQPTNVLVITRDENLIHELAKRQNGAIDFRFARRGYDASSIIAVFRPAFVIFDQAVLESLGGALLDALVADPRAAGARILVAVRKDSLGLRFRSSTVYATVQEPFDADEIVAIIQKIPIESIEAELAEA